MLSCCKNVKLLLEFLGIGAVPGRRWNCATLHPDVLLRCIQHALTGLNQKSRLCERLSVSAAPAAADLVAVTKTVALATVH